MDECLAVYVDCENINYQFNEKEIFHYGHCANERKKLIFERYKEQIVLENNDSFPLLEIFF